MKSILIDLNILIIDDNRHMLALLRAVLRGLGVRTVKAFEDVEHAYRYFERERPDLIFTDWEMEPVSGIEFVRMVRQHADPQLKRTPIVMVTAHADAERVVEARDAGISEFLVKPVSVGGVVDRLTSVFKRPRIFIRTPDYSGPDRRRIDRGPIGPERRRPVEPSFRPERASGALRTAAGILDASRPQAEVDLRGLAQKFENELPTIIERIRTECQVAAADVMNRRGHFGRIYRMTHDLKGQGSTFGYPLISEAASLLCRFIDRATLSTPGEMAIVSAHVDTMFVVAQHKIKGEGGATGQALLGKLGEMVRNYEPEM